MPPETTYYIVQIERLCGPVGKQFWHYSDSHRKHTTLEAAREELVNTDLTPSRFITGNARIIRRVTTITETVVEET